MFSPNDQSSLSQPTRPIHSTEEEETRNVSEPSEPPTARMSDRLSKLSSLISRKHQIQHHKGLQKSSDKLDPNVELQKDEEVEIHKGRKKAVSWAPIQNLVTVHPVKRWVRFPFCFIYIYFSLWLFYVTYCL